MVSVRRSEERGHANHGWLNSQHTFSFANYYDPRHMGFRALRVINEDRVNAGAGFPTHPHRDMEIISYVVEGALEHKDSMGNGSIIRPGDVQRMTAGTGVTHSEFNHSDTDPVKFLQIWVLPDSEGHEPGYEQKSFSDEERSNKLRLVASQDGREGSVVVHQDVNLYSSLLHSGESIEHSVAPGRHLWVQLIDGALKVNDAELHAGDGASLTAEQSVRLQADADAHFLLFDLA